MAKEQLILRRPIEMYRGSGVKSDYVICDDEWRTIFETKFDTPRSLQKLMKEGWKVISITQTLTSKEGSSFLAGIETVIIEKEVYEQ